MRCWAGETAREFGALIPGRSQEPPCVGGDSSLCSSSVSPFLTRSIYGDSGGHRPDVFWEGEVSLLSSVTSGKPLNLSGPPAAFVSGAHFSFGPQIKICKLRVKILKSNPGCFLS